MTPPKTDIFSLWNAHKAYACGILIQLGAWANRAHSTKLQRTFKDLQTLERTNKSNPDPSKASQLAKLRLELRSLLQEKHEHILRQLRLRFYSLHNKGGKFLASRLKSHRIKTKISSLSYPVTKQKVSNPQQIADTFADYYGTPYNIKDDPSVVQPSSDAISAFLAELKLPSLTPADLEKLNLFPNWKYKKQFNLCHVGNPPALMDLSMNIIKYFPPS